MRFTATLFGIIFKIISYQLLFAQNSDFKYYQKNFLCIPITDSFYNIADYQQSIKYNLARIDSMGNLIPQANYVLAQNYSMLENTDSAFYYLHRFIDCGPQDYRMIFIDEDFKILRNDKNQWSSVATLVEELFLMELDSSMNSQLAIKLFYIEIENLRNVFYPASFRRREPPSQNQQRKQSLNLQRQVRRIIRKNGLPTPSMVGKSAAGFAWDIIQHSRISDRHYYMIKEAFEQEDYNPEFFALTTDRWLVQNGKKQIYGTQFSKKNNEKKITLMEVEDFANINKRRVDVGLPSIEEYAKRINGVIPERYYNNKNSTESEKE